MRRKIRRKNQDEYDFDDEDPYEADNEDFKTSLLQRRIVPLVGGITDEKVAKIQGSLTELSMFSSGEDIFLFINSSGGDVAAGFELYDFLTSFLKAPVVGIVGARCFSMALTILQGCVKRIAAPHSLFCIHAIRTGNAKIVDNLGIRNHLEKIRQSFKRDSQNNFKILEKHSNMSLAEIKKITFIDNGEGAEFSAPEALKKGLIDEIAKGDKYKIF